MGFGGWGGLSCWRALLVVENNRVERFRDSTRALLVRALAMGDVVYNQTQLLLPQISSRNDSIAYVINTLTLCLRFLGQLQVPCACRSTVRASCTYSAASLVSLPSPSEIFSQCDSPLSIKVNASISEWSSTHRTYSASCQPCKL